MKQRTLKLQRIYKEGSAYLESRQISDAQIDAWYLLEYVTGISRASYYGNPEKNISEEEAKRYWEYLEKRARRIPLQHITGSQEFMGYEFLVNEHVLIPRQDTENLVEEALKVIRPDMYVLDMCTGSGCILISLLNLFCFSMNNIGHRGRTDPCRFRQLPYGDTAAGRRLPALFLLHIIPCPHDLIHIKPPAYISWTDNPRWYRRISPCCPLKMSRTQ